MLPVCQRVDFAGREGETLQVCAAVFRRGNDERRAILRPDNAIATRPSRRCLISADAAGDIEVVRLGEIPRRTAGRRVDDE
jgi:hypothetical protein